MSSPAIRMPRVIVIGGGFAGIEAAKRLALARVEVVILDRSNHHLFQPLLYQVATAVLTPADIAFPIRRIFRRWANVLVLRREVSSIDLHRRVVVGDDATEMSYDYLVLAAGAGQSYFGNDAWEAIAPGMKTLEDAARIRGRVLQAFEDAEAETDSEAQKAHLTFVIVGGGPTGVELAGAIKELAIDAMDPDFRRFDAASARVILIEGGERLLAAMAPESSAAARRALESIGVEVRLAARVTGIDAEGVLVGSERIRADTVLWAAGVEASPLGRSLGVPCDRAGRVFVGKDLSVPGHPEVFVVGDLAAATCARSGSPVPGLCPAAIQMGRFVGDAIARDVSGRKGDRPSFSYRDKGTMATIGRAKAVADIANRHFHGFIAWLLWGVVHLFFLIGFRNRVFVMASWGWAYLLFTKGSRIILGNPQSKVARHLSD